MSIFDLIGLDVADFASDQVAQEKVEPHFRLVGESVAWAYDLDELELVGAS